MLSRLLPEFLRAAASFFRAIVFALRDCLSPSYFSRRMTSPWPTSWSLSHTRYLYVAALLPGRGGPLSSRMPAGARKTLEENGQPVHTKSKAQLPHTESQGNWLRCPQ